MNRIYFVIKSYDSEYDKTKVCTDLYFIPNKISMQKIVDNNNKQGMFSFGFSMPKEDAIKFVKENTEDIELANRRGSYINNIRFPETTIFYMRSFHIHTTSMDKIIDYIRKS